MDLQSCARCLEYPFEVPLGEEGFREIDITLTCRAVTLIIRDQFLGLDFLDSLVTEFKQESQIKKVEMYMRYLPNRKSIRLKGWDYRNPGLYFITVCTQERQHHFGEIKDGIMGLSVPGCIAWHFWRQIPQHQSNVKLDAFVVMPNHIHGIVGIESVGTCHGMSPLTPQHGLSPQKQAQFGSPQSQSLSMIINHYKGTITRWCKANGHEYFGWQSRFYDHIIRHERGLHRIRKYIHDNPLRWQQDQAIPDGQEMHEQAVEYIINGEIMK